MSHPFELELSDLEVVEIEFEEQLTKQEAASVGGGSVGEFTTLALGEEGGHFWPSIPDNWTVPIKLPPGIQPPIKLPRMTTRAVGEEGGYATTLAVGEEGGDLYSY